MSDHYSIRRGFHGAALEPDPPCPCCGRFGTLHGGYHRELGTVCDSCEPLLNPTLSGMMPTAYLDGWPYRTKRPRAMG